MALTALDGDHPPRYFGGRNALVCCIYPSVDHDPVRRKSQYRDVSRQLDVLKKAGAVSPQNKAVHTGERAEYELRLDGQISHPVEAAAGSETSGLGGGISRPTGWSKQARLDGQNSHPKEKEEDVQEDASITDHPFVVASGRLVATS